MGKVLNEEGMVALVSRRAQRVPGSLTGRAARVRGKQSDQRAQIELADLRENWLKY